MYCVILLLFFGYSSVCCLQFIFIDHSGYFLKTDIHVDVCQHELFITVPGSVTVQSNHYLSSNGLYMLIF